MKLVAQGLKSLAKAIDDGKVPGSTCRIYYGADPPPDSLTEALDNLKRGAGSCSVTIVLRFEKEEEVLREFVLNKVLVRPEAKNDG